MNRKLKLIGKILGALVGLVLVVLAAISLHVENKRHSKITVQLESIEIPSSPEAVTEGKRLVQVKACADCHGSDLAGKTFINEPPIGKYSGSNLTPGKGSAVLQYKDVDWVRSIRDGIAPDGRPLVFMPASDFHGISNEDLGKMIAYLKSLSPVDREVEPQSIGPVARVLYSLGQMPLMFSYEEVNLQDQPIDKVSAAPTAEYGKYLSQACTGCHGPGFSGGKIPGTPPNWPSAKNLTPSGRFASWSEADFKTVLMSGKTPDGHQIDPQFMPWKSMQAMNDVEVQALYKYLKQLPARPEGTR